MALKRVLLAAGLCGVSALGSTQSFYPVPQLSQFDVPEIASGVGLIDQQNERLIGEKVFRQVQQQMPVLHDPWLEDQFLAVFSRVQSQAQLGQPIGLLLINDPQINAFAVPGGLFALNTGLITTARNMDEVAGVVAHEVAHVSQRHYSRSQEAFKGQGLLALAGVLVGAAIASQADGDAGAAVMMGSQAALMDQQLTYSRNREREADRIGMQYMYTAGYNPESMADFFEVMHRSTSRVSFLPDFWLTHPLTNERMSEARLRAHQLSKPPSQPHDLNFEIIKWYTVALTNQASESQLQSLAQNSSAGQMALASFYLKRGEYLQAQQALNQAKLGLKQHHLITLLQTDIYLGQNQLAQAYQTIASQQRIMPENRPLALKLAEVFIHQQQPEQAQSLLQVWIDRNPRDLLAWRLMQQTAALQKQSPLYTVNVLRYRAEVEYWSGQEESAIRSLLHAQRLAKENSAMSATIDRRVKQMQFERQMKI